MNRVFFALAALLLGACAATDEEGRVNAYKDFIEVNELEEVGSIRSFEQFGQIVLDDRHVIVTTRKEDYLLTYSRRCSEFDDASRTPDVRRDPRALYAKTDTFRGCRISALYPISKAQAEELQELSQAPGVRR